MNFIRKAAVSTLIAGSTLAGAALGIGAFTGTAGAQTTTVGTYGTLSTRISYLWQCPVEL